MSEVKKKRKITDLSKLAPEEIEWMKRRAVFLRAANKTPRRIADMLNIQSKFVQEWFADEEIRSQVEKAREDITQAGVDMLKDATAALTDNLMALAFGAGVDPKVRLQATIEALGMVGVVRVNKSESITRKRDEVAEMETLAQRMADMPLDKQQDAARKANELLASLEPQPEKVA